MSRDLVALKKVVELLPIEGADNIELARVENTGWKLVVQNYVPQPLRLYSGTQLDPLQRELH